MEGGFIWLRDLRYGLRNLTRRPSFFATAVLTFALGIGANTALFTVFDAVLLRPLVYPEPERLMVLWETRREKGGARHGPSPGNVLDWKEQNRTFDGIAAWWVESTTLLGDADADAVEVVSSKVTYDFFPVLGVKPLLGCDRTASISRSERRRFGHRYRFPRYQRRLGRGARAPRGRDSR